MATEMAVTGVRLRKVYQVDRFTLGVDWTDGRSDQWRIAQLRRHCPCAHCADEWTRERKLAPDSVADDLVAQKVESVGRYALRVTFADGHDSGIFSFELLRSLVDGK